MKIVLTLSLVLMSLNAFAIFNGSPVNEMQDKSIARFLQNRVVKILITKNGSTNKTETPCTGTFVDNKTILTAAHCLVNASKVNVVVDGIQFTSQTWMIHKDFTADLMKIVNDLGLIILSEEVSIFNSLQVINLDTNVKNGNYFAVGYGGEDGSESDGTNLRISNDSDIIITEKSALASRPAENRYILDQTKDSGAMPGDSGGPIFSIINGELYLSAVISKGICGGHYLEVENINNETLNKHNFIESKDIKFTINGGRNFTDINSRKFLNCI